jgi:nitrate reductase alpha subunit
VAGWYTPEGWPMVAYGDYDMLAEEYGKIRTFLQVLESTGLDTNPTFLRMLLNVSTQDPVYFEKIAQTARMSAVPAIPWYYKLEPDWQETMAQVEDRSYPRRLAEYFQEALKTGGYENNPHLKEAEVPSVFIYTGSNPLRRLWRHDAIEKGLWSKIDLVVGITPQLNYTSLHSDILLPAAGWYEKLGVKYCSTYIPYLILNDKVIEPLGESKCEYVISGELAKTISERAVARGKTRFTDLFGREKDLSEIYRRWSFDGAFEPTHESKEEAYDFLLRVSAISNPYFMAMVKQHGIGRAVSESLQGYTTLEQLRREGAVAIRSTGNYSSVNAIGSEKEDGKTITPHVWFIRDHWRYPTATGRMQFYIDHPWFMEADEAHPTYKKSPALEGNKQAFFLSGGHTRWSIHSQWRENPSMLRLQRGEPALWVAVEDARELHIENGETVEMYNEFGSCLCQVKVAAAMRPGTVCMYHAWQPWQFRNGVSDKTLYGSPIKPLHMVGDYAHLNYRLCGAQPGHAPRDTRVSLRKISA